MTFKSFDVVKVPFPFTDRQKTKRRPALVISSPRYFNEEAAHVVLVMITSAKNSKWPLDVNITNLRDSGLSAPSVIRMKLFTLDERFILDKIGFLSKVDRKNVSSALSKLFEDSILID